MSHLTSCLDWMLRQALDISKITRIVRWKFPLVRQVSTEELSRWLGSGENMPCLLDVRRADEYAVSHLPAARRVDPHSDLERLRAELPSLRPVVAYCSVGYRSSRLVERLQAAGMDNVQNLEGSIFKWATEGRPLEGETGKAVRTVHPCSRAWAFLLPADRRARLRG